MNELGKIYDSLERLIRNPSGCFEQTSSTTYPLVMALQVMENIPEKNDKLEKMIKESRDKLQKGYDHLLTFEASNGGYEWFGSNPGHDALTAYGLMQFNEMSDVLNVDTKMQKRVQDWLLEKANTDGTFTHAGHGLDSFGSPPPDTADAYILWVLTTIGDVSGLDKQIEKVVKHAKASGDSYEIALSAMVLLNVGREKDAKSLLDSLVQNQNEDGTINNGKSSITRSGGQDLKVETTALATLAFLKAGGAYTAASQKGVEFITKEISKSTYMGTQATILSLKVLVEVLKGTKLDGKGRFEISINDQKIDALDFDPSTNSNTLDFSQDLEDYLHKHALGTPNSNLNVVINLKNFEGNRTNFKTSYSITVEYNDYKPPSADESPLSFIVSKQGSYNEIGGVNTYNVRITNRED